MQFAFGIEGDSVEAAFFGGFGWQGLLLLTGLVCYDYRPHRSFYLALTPNRGSAEL